MTEQQRIETVRDFLRGFLQPTRSTSRLGQALAEGLIRPLIAWSDEAIAQAIERGREVRG